MAILTWDDTGTRAFETGVSEGVLFLGKNRSSDNNWRNGVAWNGLIGVSHSPSSETNSFYADDIKYGIVRSSEDFGFTIEAYAYPQDFNGCLGCSEIVPGLMLSNQDRDCFALVYKSKIGDDEHPGIDKGYKLHIIYNATANPSEKQYQTINDSPDAITYSWECTTKPHKLDFHGYSMADPHYQSLSYISIDSTKISDVLWNRVNRYINGSTYGFAFLPKIERLIYEIVHPIGV